MSVDWLKKLFGTRRDAAPEVVFQNPFDGKAYAGKTYVGQGGRDAPAPGTPQVEPVERNVKLGMLRLLTLENDVAARANVKDIVTFVSKAHRLAEEHLGRSAQPFKLLVQFTCRPSVHDVQLARQGDASEELLNAYYIALKAVDALPVRDGEVSFQVEMSIERTQ